MQSTLEQGGTRVSEHTDEGDQQDTEGEGERERVCEECMSTTIISDNGDVLLPTTDELRPASKASKPEIGG